MLGSVQGDSSFSLYDYPIPGKYGLAHCEEHGRQLELNVVTLFDKAAIEASPPDHCWVCKVETGVTIPGPVATKFPGHCEAIQSGFTLF